MTIDYSKYDGCTEGPWGAVMDDSDFSDLEYIVDSNGNPIIESGLDCIYFDKEHDLTLVLDAPLLLAHCKKRDVEREELIRALQEINDIAVFHTLESFSEKERINALDRIGEISRQAKRLNRRRNHEL